MTESQLADGLQVLGWLAVTGLLGVEQGLGVLLAARRKLVEGSLLLTGVNGGLGHGAGPEKQRGGDAENNGSIYL